MRVELLAVTPDALDLLLLTKATRLSFDEGALAEIKKMTYGEKLQQLEYMRHTIQSSWEFVDYTLLLVGVSRSFTHQLVRTRTASYAQQSQRTVDMRDFEYVAPVGLANGLETEFDDMMEEARRNYKHLTAYGEPAQVARAVLPEATATNIIIKASLRTLADMAKVRLCTRTQGEYQDVFRAIRAAVISEHEWAEPFLRVACAATGVCAFPNFHECPIKPGVYNPETGMRWDEKMDEPLTINEIQSLWEVTRFQATPAEMKRNE